MHVVRPIIAALVFVGAAAAARSSDPAAGELLSDGAMLGTMSPEIAQRDVMAPPWHGNVRQPECCPRCAPPTMFHADPCGQLGCGHRLHHGGAMTPPLFPRLHAWWSYGSMPTPRSPALPRCRQCGAPIEGGF